MLQACAIPVPFSTITPEGRRPRPPPRELGTGPDDPLQAFSKTAPMSGFIGYAGEMGRTDYDVARQGQVEIFGRVQSPELGVLAGGRVVNGQTASLH
jgi:hypothetical protein